MTAYVQSPFKPTPELLVSGKTSYFFGSYNDKTGPTLGNVVSDKSNGTTTATLVFQIQSGNIPANGSLITVIGTANGGGNFNVTNVAISNVTQVNTPDDGTYSVTYTISSTASPTIATADKGMVQIPQPEVAEALVAGASVEKTAPFNNPNLQQGKSLSVTTTFPSLPTSVAIFLQGADLNLDPEYQDIAQVATVAGGVSTMAHWNSGQDNMATSATPGAITANPGGVNLLNYRFYRIRAGVVTGGTLPTIICKIEP